ncbi:PREDICTED: F-box only protein 36 [Nanorana parkeri]|uniref:F-box only protein 36 n=1 Tax=Nanorana parkeri TaxID=125878 RepID=UPI0008541F4E|nr:PREDICTED: F-box only protein 36 [Nanorana parkeri]
MAALLPEILFECDGQAPAPSKDFYQLQVTRSEVIWRWWKISLRSEFRETKPGELKESHQDFVDDSTLQAQIGIVFSQKVLSYVLDLCRGQYDFLERLSESLLLYILTFLDLEDIAQLSQVSHTFQKLCNSDKLWEHIVERSCDTVTTEMRSLAQSIGWKQFFFTNKLQLQLQLRRWRKKQEKNTDIFLE